MKNSFLSVSVETIEHGNRINLIRFAQNLIGTSEANEKNFWRGLSAVEFLAACKK